MQDGGSATRARLTKFYSVSHQKSLVKPGQHYPRGVALLTPAIKTFPSSLQRLCIQLGDGPEIRLTEEPSAFILMCGKSLWEFSTNLVLSTQAIIYLMGFPNLRVWVARHGPPQVTDLIHYGVPDGVTSLFLHSTFSTRLEGRSSLRTTLPTRSHE